ncbi:MAG TPA: hypothetical protein VF503_15140 [Sphingobium sp.]|uniref:hypothetical protein n=1 Tax=Sphingobium sp. TaxID=1912891 RepID=UPI002ED1D22B
MTRAMALALMRQAHELLQAAKEDDTAGQLQLAVDTLLRASRAQHGQTATAS